MFHNYFFLKRLANELNTKLVGFELLSCFSQNKDELILGFADPKEEFYLRANLDPNISLLEFPEGFHRANKNSVDLFQELLGCTVSKVEVFQYERSFQLVFDHGLALIFKMHGRRANILLADQATVRKVFRNNLAEDLELVPSELHKDISISEDTFRTYGSDPLALLPALGKETKVYLSNMGFDKLDPTTKWEAFKALLHDLEHNPIFLSEQPSPGLSLLKGDGASMDGAIYASNWLYRETARTYFFDAEKQKLIQQLKQKIKRSENYIRKTSDQLMKLRASRNPEELANLIMANLHAIQTGQSKAVLHDFYTDTPIEIKLNVNLTPQKNAEAFYRKSKNRHQEIDQLNHNISAKEQLIDSVSRQILEIDDALTTKQLRALAKKFGLKKEVAAPKETLPYHKFELNGWTVLVGKNAKANDELTLKVANKNDLWLHAKDVAGSHVVVRNKPGQNFSKQVIEEAAALAAYNSKRKSDSLCPVIYTLKKYVRKAKGSPAGQVIVDKEEVAMVAPEMIAKA